MYNKIRKGHLKVKNKIKILIVFITLAFSLSIMSNTYSRYVADANGDITLAFAKWQILINDEDITNGEEKTLSITPVIMDNANVAAGKLAPSSVGYYDIEIDATNVETSFNLDITLEENIDMPDLKISKYSINDEEEIDIEDNEINKTFYYQDGLGIINIRIYFEWYDMDDNLMDDEEDTRLVNTNDSITITTNLSFEQEI